ncbi:hypothetical protein VTK73DRAFT_1177 [Phialemonium thermophilum]|uniref:Uncharacterized protein n=1 Tax=Phialemonium thermophilum TaxID=223376 RepID=A0ABR3VTU4_9PEZI
MPSPSQLTASRLRGLSAHQDRSGGAHARLPSKLMHSSPGGHNTPAGHASDRHRKPSGQDASCEMPRARSVLAAPAGRERCSTGDPRAACGQQSSAAASTQEAVQPFGRIPADGRSAMTAKPVGEKSKNSLDQTGILLSTSAREPDPEATPSGNGPTGLGVTPPAAWGCLHQTPNDPRLAAAAAAEADCKGSTRRDA